MSDDKRLLRIRREIKSKRPKFVRPESWRYVRVKKSWRRPKGIDHKVAEKHKGYPKAVSVGYRGPKAVRGQHPSGYELVHIYNIDMLDTVNPENQAIVIGHTVGSRKKQDILNKADELRIKIINKPIRVAVSDILDTDELELEDEFELLDDEDLDEDLTLDETLEDEDSEE